MRQADKTSGTASYCICVLFKTFAFRSDRFTPHHSTHQMMNMTNISIAASYGRCRCLLYRTESANSIVESLFADDLCRLHFIHPICMDDFELPKGQSELVEKHVRSHGCHALARYRGMTLLYFSHFGVWYSEPRGSFVISGVQVL